LSDSSFVAGLLAGEDNELDAAAALVVVLLMQPPRMLLVPAYWLAFADDQALNLAVPYSHPCPKLVSAQQRIPHALVGILKSRAKVFMIGWMLLQESLIFYLLRNQLVKFRRCRTCPFWNLQGKIRHFISVRHLIAVQTLASKYTWHLLNLRYAPSLYCRAAVASETRKV